MSKYIVLKSAIEIKRFIEPDIRNPEDRSFGSEFRIFGSGYPF